MRNLNFLFSNFGQGESRLTSTCLRNLRYAAVALFILLGVGNVWGATATIQSTCWGTTAQSYQTDVKTFTDEQGNKWKATGYGVTANTNIIIGKGGANYLETPNFSGNISSIAVTWSGNTSYYLALQTTTGTELDAKQNPSTATEATFTVSGSYTQLRLVGRRNSGTSNAAATITKVVVTYGASCSNSVTISTGTESNGEITTIATSPIATCSATASDRRVTITITPDDCYDAPSDLTWTKSSGTVTASKQSGPTDNGDGTYSYVYQFNQNDNGAGTFGVTCTAKAAGKTVYFDAGPGVSASSSLTENCDGSGITLPNVTASEVCKGWTTFAGWATAAVSDSTTTSVTVYDAGSKYVPASNNMTLYAVYSKTKSGGSSSVTIAPEDLGVTSGNAIETKTVNGITFKGELGGQGTSTNVPKYYSGTPNTIRCYASNDFTISSTSAISQIDFTYNGSYSGGTPTPSVGSWAVTPRDGWNQTWKGSSTSIKFRIGNSQWRITSVKVTTGGGSTTYYCSDPNCCTQLGSINGSVSWSKGKTSQTHPNKSQTQDCSRVWQNQKYAWDYKRTIVGGCWRVSHISTTYTVSPSTR